MFIYCQNKNNIIFDEKKGLLL